MNQGRLPAVEKAIKDISKDDVRVRVLGRVIDESGGFLVVDDGTGKIGVSASQGAAAPGETVRVIGRVTESDSGLGLESEVIQVLNKVNLNLYRKVVEAEKKAA